MDLPFTSEQFMAAFKDYNNAVFPMQLALNLIGIAAVYFSVKQHPWSNKFIPGSLAFLWLWVGIVYHLLFFTEINPAAYLFAALFVFQALIMYFKITWNKLSFALKPDRFGIAGGLLIAYALIFYPLIGYLIGHVYPASPTFGLPCPTTIFTFGILLAVEKKCPVSILIIPFTWSLIGFSAALKLGMYEDTGLLIAGLLATAMILLRNKRLNRQPQQEPTA